MEELPTNLMYVIAVVGALACFALGVWAGYLMFHPDNWKPEKKP